VIQVNITVVLRRAIYIIYNCHVTVVANALVIYPVLNATYAIPKLITF